MAHIINANLIKQPSKSTIEFVRKVLNTLFDLQDNAICNEFLVIVWLNLINLPIYYHAIYYWNARRL